MSQAHSSSFPLSQRELVGLALHRGARRPHAPSAQRDRVRQALMLGVGGGAKAGRGARRGIVR